jgi:hypothetical protein
MLGWLNVMVRKVLIGNLDAYMIKMHNVMVRKVLIGSLDAYMIKMQ